MAAIPQASAVSAPNAPVPSAGGGLSGGGAEDRFLTLLVAQMRNQDPLNPLENAQLTTQMAQISTVSGIDRLNATLQSLAGAVSESQFVQAAALVGRDVLVPGDTLDLAEGWAAGGFQLAEAADQVSIAIVDGGGNIVHRADLGPQSAGVHAIVWDGLSDAGQPMPAGTYYARLSAMRAGGELAVTSLASARVLGVSRDGESTSLELSGLGRRPYAQVSHIL